METKNENKKFRNWMLTIIGLSTSAIIFWDYFTLFAASILVYGLICTAIYMLKEETQENSTKNFILKWVVIALSPSLLCLVNVINYDSVKALIEAEKALSHYAINVDNDILWSLSSIFEEIIYFAQDLGVFLVVGIILLIITIVVCLIKKATKKAGMAFTSSLLTLVFMGSFVDSFCFDDLNSIELEMILICIAIILFICAIYKKHYKQIIVTAFTLPIALSAMLEITGLVAISLRDYKYYWIEYVFDDIIRLLG